MGLQNPVSESSPVRAFDPAENGIAFAANVDAVLTTFSRYIYVATAGTLSVDFAGGLSGVGLTGVSFGAVPAGTLLPMKVAKINGAGTTCTGVILL